MASDTLFRNEKIVKILFETTPDMLTILDKDGKILDCNHHFTENFGYDKSEAVGKIGPVDMVSDRDRQKAVSAFNQLLTYGIKLNVPIEVMRKDKSTFHSIWSGAKLSDELGNFEGYLITGKDLTDIKKLQDDLKKEKDEKLMLIGDMTARIAHDLRNPLNVIINSAKLLENQLENNPDENISKRVAPILRSAERMRHQVEDVMIYVGTRPLNLSEHSVLGLIASSIENIIVPDNIQINCAKNDVKIMCDGKQLDAVFGNLILNSIQAIGENKGTVTINWKVDGDHIIIDFIDSGRGIPDEIMHRIFESFFTTKQMGTGLGLIISKNIIEQHNGTLSVKNNPTTFTVTLPVKLSA
ncbi:MAG: PAS domain S-box protein [Thaumarchaeota archaeon]|nr:PAS domain S-box protein [Nitrososphaerota archaeon]